MQVSTQSIHIFREEIRCHKTMKHTGDLSTKLLFLQNDENSLTTFLHSTDAKSYETITCTRTRSTEKGLRNRIFNMQYQNIKSHSAIKKSSQA